jgi:NAD-dependent aldehyde dehydrogenases
MSNNQTVNELMKKSRIALKELENYTQEQVDDMCIAIGLAIQENAELLAKEAIEETRLGNYEHKVMKNFGTGGDMWSIMKGKKSVGVIGEDTEKGLIYVANPKGVIGSVAPTTNPTITPLGNAMIAIKGRNTLIIAPHPRAKKVSTHTVEIMNEALRKIGAPENVIQIIKEPSIEGTQELMKTSDVVVATGGMGMVKAAYSSGKPAFGVGQGNVQHIVADDYDDLDLAAAHIVFGRSLDNGVICAGDQSLIMPKSKETEMIAAMERNGAYYVGKDEIVEKFKNVIFVDGHLNPETVGQSAQFIANLAGVKIPDGTKVILLKAEKYGSEELLCGEKMCPVTVALTYDTFEEAVAIAKANLLYQGAGHSAAIHSNNKEKITYTGINLPVCRLCVNQPGVAAGGAGLGNSLNPTTSLGCGSWGGNSISENLTYEHLINISRIAYPKKGNAPTREEIWAK